MLVLDDDLAFQNCATPAPRSAWFSARSGLGITSPSIRRGHETHCAKPCGLLKRGADGPACAKCHRVLLLGIGCGCSGGSAAYVSLSREG
jgi:hypothetical protein